MFADALLLLPDFLLILLGFALCRWTALDREVWAAVERLVYWLLFPVLLFASIVKSPLHPGTTAALATGGVAVVGTGFLMTLMLARFKALAGQQLASGAQCAFRFNSYVALALAERLGGASYIAWTALLLAVCVPLCNAGAVWTLARHGGQNVWREVLRNPLIVGTLAGLAGNLAGLHLPAAVDTSLTRVSGAALLLGIRHAALPVVGVAMGLLLGLPKDQARTLLAFAALPTASSAFVLAARMGGDAPYVAGLITASTLLGMVSIPLSLSLFALL
jgi:malonate transporter and related proteins